MGTLLQDLRVAVRALLKTPAFPLAAIGTLAIGIAATTAIFSTVNAALLKPLPYPDAGRLYSLRTALTDGRVTTGNLAPVEIIRLNDPSLSIARAAGVIGNDVTLLQNDGTPVKTRAYGVSEGFFELFGLPLTLGGFSTAPLTDEHAADRHDLVSHLAGHVRRRSGGRSARRSALPRSRTTVAGVAPRDFDTPPGANFWFLTPLDPQGVNHSFEGFMRLKPGATIERARSEMTAVMASVGRDFPGKRRHRPRLRGPSAHRIDRRRARADPRRRALGDGRAAAARVRECDQPDAGARRGARTRDGGARGTRRRSRTHRAAAAHRVAAARRRGRRRGRARRLRLRALAADARRVAAAAARRGRLRRSGAALRARGSARLRRARRLRAGAPAGVDRRERVDERGRPIGIGRARHRALVERDDHRRGRARGHRWSPAPDGWCAASTTSAPSIRDSRPTAGCSSTPRRWASGSATMRRSFSRVHRSARAAARPARRRGCRLDAQFPLRPGPENALLVHFDGDPDATRAPTTRVSASSARASSRRWA